MTTLRDYQANAVDAGVELLKKTEQTNGAIIIPTGGGKSHVISAIADNIDDETLILQPSKEILEQNYKKLFEVGQRDLGIYSASLGSKAINHITLATIGSIYKKPELFKQFKQVIVDECDLINPKEGMYKDFFEALDRPVLGTTATPWRMYPGHRIGTKRVRGGRMIDVYSGSINKIITRTRPRLFSDLIHITQIGELYEQGYLCPLKYVEGVFDQSQLTLNSTGNDYTDATHKRISRDIIRDAVYAVMHTKAKHHLVFTARVEEAVAIEAKLKERGVSCAVLTGETPKAERDSIISRFKGGVLDAVINVGVLTVGFDFPALDHIVVARALNSARLLYQILGRGIRIFAGKAFCTLTDLCGNVDRLGKIEDWVIKDHEGDKKYRLFNGNGPLTGIDMKSGMDLEKAGTKSQDHSRIHFGKYKGKAMSEVPQEYLEWVLENFSDGAFKNQAKDELARRVVANV